MIVNHKVEMDLINKGGTPRINAVQGDSNTRAIELVLYADGTAWPVPEDATAVMRYCKPDGTQGVYDTLPDDSLAWSANENVISFFMAPQMLTVPGIVFAQIEIDQGSSVLASFTIQIYVEANPSDDAVESEDYVNWLQWMENELAKWLTEAKESGAFTGPQGPEGPQGPAVPIDSTLTISGQAADAGATGTALSGKVSRVLLWENASPTSAFGAQTVTLKANDCMFFEVAFAHRNGAVSNVIRFKAGGTARIVTQAGFTDFQAGELLTISRAITASTQNSITFGATLQKSESIDWGEGVSNLIPTSIYGVKGMATE